MLDNVASRLEEWTLRATARWQRREVRRALPRHAAAPARCTTRCWPDDPLAEAYLLNYTDFLSPDSLQLGRTGSDERETAQVAPGLLRRQPACASSSASPPSRDGTRVPYFVVWPQGAKADGDNPTLLYGYGGFEVSQQPCYSGAHRPRLVRAAAASSCWPTSAAAASSAPAGTRRRCKADKQKSYDDFAAVAEDLIAQPGHAARAAWASRAAATAACWSAR